MRIFMALSVLLFTGAVYAGAKDQGFYRPEAKLPIDLVGAKNDPHYAASKCEVVTANESDYSIGASLNKHLKYLIFFNDDQDLRFCTSIPEIAAGNICRNDIDGKIRQIIVELTRANTDSIWAKSKIVLEGECQDTDRTRLVQGAEGFKFIKVREFKATSDWTITRPLQ